MNKTFNLYCDESCHLEHDIVNYPYMLISYVSSSYNQVKLHCDNIRALKIKHFFQGEIKWSALSKSQYPFYSELIDYFFATDLQFRAIIIEKAQLKHSEFKQTHEEFYDKMYYQLLYHKVNPDYNYNIYMDIKDIYTYRKAASLKNYLDKNSVCIRKIQIIKSYESELMQLTDVLMGAISYYLRGKNKVTAKNNIIRKIESHCNLSLNKSTSKDEEKFNIFHIDLK